MEESKIIWQQKQNMAYFSLFSKWIYRGEGNKTLVISNPETRQVLCLQKSNVSSKDQPNYTKNANRKESSSLRQEIEKSIKLCKQVFVPLLSEKYVEPGTIVELPEDFMTKIKDLVTSANKERPNFRLNKEVNGQSKFGILMPDFCFVSGDGIYANEVDEKAAPPTFCVEIKPKYGTLPACVGLEKSLYSEVKESICKYCLLQWTKVDKEGKYPQRSGYCPLDLFSSDMRRVWHALTCLLKNPQNNFRIFQNGRLVHSAEMMTPSYHRLDNGYTTDKIPSNTGTIEHYQHLLQLEEVLRHSFANHHPDSLMNHKIYGEIDGTNLRPTTIFLATLLQLLVHDSNETTIHCHHHRNHHSSNHPVCEASRYDEARCSTGVPKLLTSKGLAFGRDGVLTKILDLQKLDSIGTDRAFNIFNELCANDHKDGIDSYIFSLYKNSGRCCVDDDMQKNATCDNAHTNANNGCIYSNGDSSIASEMGILAKFLITASANDCSVMISFQEVMDGITKDLSCFKDVITGKTYKYSIAIVDLDQKESGRIPKYYKEYHDIVDNYLHFKQI